jgi:hypothetical protein
MNRSSKTVRSAGKDEASVIRDPISAFVRPQSDSIQGLPFGGVEGRRV